MNHSYNLQFEKLCETLAFGELVKAPVSLSGGLLHRMFAMETSTGKYAVKALNPQIMARPTAFHNFIKSEKIAVIASDRIPAQPAKITKGSFLHHIDGQFYLVFDWIEGDSLKAQEITLDHCKRIGGILAGIHHTDFSGIGRDQESSNGITEIDWRWYLKKGRESNSAWVKLLSDNIQQLYLWNSEAKESSELLAGESVLSHRDLEPKNVMWSQDGPILIDWESAGEINPKHDLIETAIYWSINENGQIEKESFLAFIGGYQERYGKVRANWRKVLELGYWSKLGWLEYSFKRSLRIECTDEKEEAMGTEQVIGTIHALKDYEGMVSEIESWL
ncbi:aminoglycoside phosphotransferase family protein [Paenibacillus sp. CAU 1782]